MFLKRVPVFRKRMGMLPLSYGRRAGWIHSPAGKSFYPWRTVFLPSNARRWVASSLLSLAIPLLFRDQANRSKTPGMKYWFDTCTIREGTMPLKMGVRSVFCPKA